MIDVAAEPETVMRRPHLEPDREDALGRLVERQTGATGAASVQLPRRELGVAGRSDRGVAIRRYAAPL